MQVPLLHLALFLLALAPALGKRIRGRGYRKLLVEYSETELPSGMRRVQTAMSSKSKGKGKGCGSKSSKSKGKGKGSSKGKGSKSSKTTDECDGDEAESTEGDSTTPESTGFCSCTSCTSTVLNNAAGDFTCGDRIQFLLETYPATFPTAVDACHRIGSLEFPDECGACDPSTCDGRVEQATEKPFCGCDKCTSDVWNSDADGFTCGARISWAAMLDQATQNEACADIASTYAICKDCDPDACTNPRVVINPAPTPSPTQATTVMPTKATTMMPTKATTISTDTFSPTANPTRGALSSSETAAPTAATTASPTQSAVPRCGCAECLPATLQSLAPANNTDGATCAGRIDYLMGMGMTELDSCRAIAGATGEFPDVCGPACDPDSCPTAIIPDFTAPPTEAPIAPDQSTEPDLECFPPYEDRVRWENVWDNYTVEVKQHAYGEKCGPFNNTFSDATVGLYGDELVLRFMKIDGEWTASEVRVLLNDGQPYTYGTYQFDVKSVSVIDTDTDTVISNVLPPDLVLGMFTWNHVYGETNNHEVDIEIARWGNPSGTDGQFLVQPPESPHFKRFYTGEGETLDQGGHLYEFDWNPTELAWYTDAGDGESLVYTTEQAISEGLEDRIQCLPADIEVRMNLWGLQGTQQPQGMEGHHIAEVVISGFSFTPSGIEGVGEGEFCSKHCQCLEDLLCESGVCTVV